MQNLRTHFFPTHYFDKLEKAAYGFTLLFAFGLPWSNAIFRIGLWGMAICLLTSLSWIQHWKATLKSPVTLTSIALFAWISAGSIYSTSSSDLIIHDISHYRKLLALAPFIMVCRSNERRVSIFISLFLGIAVLITPTILDAIGIKHFFGFSISTIANESYQAGNSETPKNLTYWKNHIVHGYFACILMAATTIALLVKNKYKILYLLITLICAYDLLILIRGRAALICAIITAALIATSFAKSNNAKILILLSSILITLSATAIPGIQQRLNSIKTEVQGYSNSESATTSAGIRLHYWSISKYLFIKSPIIGTGPGGFRSELIAIEDPLLHQNHYHAHNEYITILSQSGVIGFIILLTLIYKIYKSAKTSKFKGINFFGMAFLFIFCINAMTDASLFNDLEGWSFVIIAATITAEDCFPNFIDEKI